MYPQRTLIDWFHRKTDLNARELPRNPVASEGSRVTGHYLGVVGVGKGIEGEFHPKRILLSKVIPWRAAQAALDVKEPFIAWIKRKSYFKNTGTWRSLVAHYLGVVGVAGSNPAVPTTMIHDLPPVLEKGRRIVLCGQTIIW